eukprot:6040055-Amphidinium_carterae.1
MSYFELEAVELHWFYSLCLFWNSVADLQDAEQNYVVSSHQTKLTREKPNLALDNSRNPRCN